MSDAPHPRSRFSLAATWYGIVVLVAVLPLVVFLPWSGDYARSLLLEDALLCETQHNQQIQMHIEQEGRRLVTLLINKSDPVAYTLATRRDDRLLAKLFDAVMQREQAFHELLLVTPEGRALKSLHRTAEDQTYEEVPVQALRRVEASAPELAIPLLGRTYIGSPFMRNERFMFTVAVPVEHEGVLQAVLSGVISAEDLWESLSPQLSPHRGASYLVDSRGSLLTSAPGSTLPGSLITNLGIVRALLAHEEWNPEQTYAGLSGDKVHGIVGRIDLLNWGVVSEIPTRDINAPISQALTRTAVIAVLISAVFAGVGLVVVRRIVGPLAELTYAAGRVAEGDYSQRVRRSGVREFDILASGFNAMVAGTRQRESVLKQNKRALEESQDRLQHHANQQTAVANLGVLALSSSFDGLMNQAVETIARTLDVELSDVHQLLPEPESLVLLAGVGWNPGLVGHAPMSVEPKSHADYLLRAQEPVVVEDLETETRFHRSQFLHDHGVVSCLSVIIHGEEQPFGILGAHTCRQRTFTADDARFVQTIANILGETIRRIQAEDDAIRFSRVLEQSLNEIYIFDAKTLKFIRVNRGARENLGYSMAELAEFTPAGMAPEFTREAIREILQPLWEGTEQILEMTTVLRRKNGTQYPVETYVQLMREDPPIFVAVVVDITERKRAEEKREELEAHLRQQQKLESIGTLAAGVAHEINNPINGIMNYARLIDERLAPESALHEFAKGIGRETERVAAIVRNLLTFARRDKESHCPARIIDIVNNTVALIRTIIRRDQIALTVDVPDDLPSIDCRHQQIQQALMNLLTNARDALNARYPHHDPDKTMTVSVRAFEKEGHRWLRTIVEDHGGGIPSEISDRLFDPFFTTKDRTKGTGLGLSITRGIVEDHQGALFFECEPGLYTRFYLDLPLDYGRSLDTTSQNRAPREPE